MKIWYFAEHNDGFWFRLFGYGLSFYRTALFSDRLFKRKRYFGHYIEILK